MEIQNNPEPNGVHDAACLGLGKDPIPRQKVTNCLQRIGRKPITYYNVFPPKKWLLLFQRQVNYVEEIIVTRDTEHLGISRREVIQTISDMG